jgi:DinB superfamily
MNAQEAITTVLKGSQHLVNTFLADLSDQDILVHPVPGANHIAWQIGHLIDAEIMMAPQHPAFVYPQLPAGFKQQHEKATAFQEPPKGFATKDKYLELFNAVRNSTLAGVSKLTPTDLDKATTGQMAEWAPTVGAILILTNNHTMMHMGQFTVLRRKLGKPVLF